MEAHGSLLSGAHDWLALNAQEARGAGLAVALALELHAIQLGRSLQILFEMGYAEVAEAATRAMVSAGVNVLAILRSDRDAVALQYLLYSAHRREVYLTNFVNNGLLTPEKRVAYDGEAAELDARVLQEYRAKGIEPRQLGGNRTDTWSGLSDRALFEYAEASPWYEIHYSPLSDGAHVSVAAISHELDGMGSGRIATGPRWSDPLLLISTSVDVIGHTLVTLAHQLNPKGVPDAQVVRTGAVEAVQRAFQAATGQGHEE